MSIEIAIYVPESGSVGKPVRRRESCFEALLSSCRTDFADREHNPVPLLQ